VNSLLRNNTVSRAEAMKILSKNSVDVIVARTSASSLRLTDPHAHELFRDICQTVDERVIYADPKTAALLPQVL
jgi:hypothetical protein